MDTDGTYMMEMYVQNETDRYNLVDFIAPMTQVMEVSVTHFRSATTRN